VTAKSPKNGESTESARIPLQPNQLKNGGHKDESGKSSMWSEDEFPTLRHMQEAAGSVGADATTERKSEWSVMGRDPVSNKAAARRALLHTPPKPKPSPPPPVAALPPPSPSLPSPVPPDPTPSISSLPPSVHIIPMSSSTPLPSSYQVSTYEKTAKNHTIR
ncbi:hypothetical protein PMAYCL1PPCAC_24178, partial [Pristionchus mayeri]